MIFEGNCFAANRKVIDPNINDESDQNYNQSRSNNVFEF